MGTVEGPRGAAKAALDAWGGIDILVNNAGMSFVEPILEKRGAFEVKADEKATLRTAAETSTTAFAKLAEAQSAVTSSTTNFSTLVQGLGTTANRIGANGLDASKKAEADIKDTSAAAVRAVLLYTLMGALLAACMVVVLTRTITGRIARLVDASNRMSLGELDVEIPVEGRDEVGQLAESLHRMQASLRAAIERLRARRAAA